MQGDVQGSGCTQSVEIGVFYLGGSFPRKWYYDPSNDCVYGNDMGGSLHSSHSAHSAESDLQWMDGQVADDGKLRDAQAWATALREVRSKHLPQAVESV